MINTRLAVTLIAFAFVAFMGWTARSWFEDSKALAASEAMQKTLDAAMQRESNIAGVIENRLASLQANERIIDRGIIREIEKPVYQRVCIEPDLVSLLNAAADGEQARLPEKLAGQVSEDTTAPQ